MSLAIVYSRASTGISAPLVTVETHISRGMPGFHMVGLPEAEVKESKYRVRSALLNSCFEFPAKRITVNLAPADLPKEGGRFDLPIALGILAASGQIPSEKLNEYEFTGELALSGELRPVRGMLPMVIGAQEAGRCLIVPVMNADEASLVRAAQVFSAQHLLEVCAYLKGEHNLKKCDLVVESITEENNLDLADVRDQPFAKRALEIAAAGKHSMLFVGPPGTGKTMLASRLPGILPPLTEQQALEIAAIRSISKIGFDPKKWLILPFRHPHHSCSSVALVGGGSPPRPGEISLAHYGVLFLDELPEFHRHTLEALREPLESGQVTISRSAHQATFPAKFQLIAAMNPCPCGFAGAPKDICRCTEEKVQRYLAKLSGPLMDRIDLQVEVASLPPNAMTEVTVNQETSAVIKERVIKARQYQIERQKKPNSELTVGEITQYCSLNEESKQLLAKLMTNFNFSARVYHRILKVARTIADLRGFECVERTDISEALMYRFLDKSKINNQRSFV